MSKFDGKAILAIQFQCDDLDRSLTIGEYLIELLETLWREDERFSGKRPFGNSGWSYDLYRPLVAAGLIGGEIDAEGYLLDVDESAGAAAIFSAIEALKPATPEK